VVDEVECGGQGGGDGCGVDRGQLAGRDAAEEGAGEVLKDRGPVMSLAEDGQDRFQRVFEGRGVVRPAWPERTGRLVELCPPRSGCLCGGGVFLGQ
jgi:hypothetical protein